MAAVDTQDFKKNLRPTNYRGSDRIQEQLVALGLRRRWWFVRALNWFVDGFHRSWLGEHSVQIFFAIAICLLLLSEPKIERWWSSRVDGSIEAREAKDDSKNQISEPINAPQGVVPTFTSHDWVRTFVLVFTLLLGYSRWHVTKQQDTISNTFERKRKTNEFIIERQADLKGMILEATDPVQKEELPAMISFEEGNRFLTEIRESKFSGGSISFVRLDLGFIQRMFVFLELDNLEFAFVKHDANLLDDFEMLRACQIFESRCLDPEFRYLALLLGKGNYDPRFLQLTKRLVLYGHLRSGAAKPSTCPKSFWEAFMKNKPLTFLAAIVGLVALSVLAYRSFMNAPELPKVVVVLPSDRNPFWLEVRRGAEAAAKDLHDEVQVSVTASNDQDATSQNAILDNLHARHEADALVFGPANDHTSVPKVAKFLKENIPVIVIDTELNKQALQEERVATTAFLGSSNVDGGEKAAREMNTELVNRGSLRKVLLIQGSFVHQSAIDRAAGFTKVATELGLEIEEVKGEWRRDRAQELTSSLFARGRLGGIFASNDDMALGAIAALKGLNLAKEEWPVIIGFDATAEAIDAIKSGEMHASIRQDASKMGEEGVRRALRALRNDKTLETYELLPVTVYRKP